MDHKDLALLAQRACLQVLNYHLASTENGRQLADLDQSTKDEISAHIARFLPLLPYADDSRVAQLEIISDAAVDVAKKFNVNEHWFHGVFQGMTSITLVPNLHANMEVKRLSLHMFDAEEETDQQEDDQEDDQDYREDDGEINKGTNQAWTDLEVYKLIEYKVLGMSRLAIAERMGRSLSSITNKWHQASTKPHSEWKDVIDKKFKAKMDDEDQEAAVKAKEQTKRRKGGKTASATPTSRPVSTPILRLRGLASTSNAEEATAEGVATDEEEATAEGEATDEEEATAEEQATASTEGGESADSTDEDSAA
ncbi:hypothetical protein Daus18300_003797 [Diaporthe australafricana]|uniref:Uncharacterized protein n=1 Tax=Diaporthe australafricana TaxID=127596 RepID=A0ABR3XD93_9PEZI